MISDTKIIFYGGTKSAIQSTLDFDYACGKAEPSLVAIVNPGTRQWHNYHWGRLEILLPTLPSLSEAFEKYPKVSAVVNFASERSAGIVARETVENPAIKYQVIVAEGMPEREVRMLRILAQNAGQMIIGPSTVGALWAGSLRLGNVGGTVELQAEAHVHGKGSVGILTKSGGLLNELCHMAGKVTDGTHTAIAVGGDLYPCTRLVDVALRYEKDPEIKMMLMLGEIGGAQEYEVAQALKEGKITKPLIAWCSGICAKILPGEFQFGHAGAQAQSSSESAEAKNIALREAGALVPENFEQFENLVKQTAKQILPPGKGSAADGRPVDAQEQVHEGGRTVDFSIFQNRIASNLISTISDDRGESPKYMTERIVDLAANQSVTIGDIMSLLWFRKKLPRVALDFFDIVIKLVADHGPNVSGAHNTIIAARAGKDLVSSLASGLLTIGPRFGGAIGGAARNWQRCVKEHVLPRDFVDDMKAKDALIPGIGHAYKNKMNPDDRVAMLERYARKKLQETPHLDFARAVEEITLGKKHNLILNIDGTIAAVALDIFRACGFTPSEIERIISYETLDGFFVLGRTIGLIGHHIDQKRLGAPLYRHPAEETLYWNEREL